MKGLLSWEHHHGNLQSTNLSHDMGSDRNLGSGLIGEKKTTFSVDRWIAGIIPHDEPIIQSKSKSWNVRFLFRRHQDCELLNC